MALEGRYETVYPPQVCKEYTDFIYGKGNWRRFLEKYPTEMILINRSSGAYGRLLAGNDWRPVYQDAGSALFVKAAKIPALASGRN